MVDDDPAKLLVLRSILADMDQNIIEVNSGSEALRQCLQHDFAVILLDVNMPGMDGFETAQLIRQRPRSAHTPIIFVTAISTADVHITQGYSLGAVDYILTPIMPDILKAKVKVFIDLFQMAEEIKRHSIAFEEANKELEHRIQEIERLNRELEISNEELESFSASVSHDLRAPQRHIDGFTQMLLDNYSDKLDDRGKKFIERIKSSVERMGELMEDLLKLSRITRQKIEPEQVDLSEIFRSIAASLQQSQPERKADFVITDGITVYGDAGLLRIVLENLLSNAWKYSSKQPEVKIEFGRADLVGKEAYYVRDNGSGFDMSLASQLFMPFKRFHSANDYPGTGIGLSIVHRIVRRHGGRIWAESEVGKGATFYFTIG